MAEIAMTTDVRALLDRTSLELFLNDGRYVMSFCMRPELSNRKITWRGEGTKIESLTIHELRPAVPVFGEPGS